MRCVLITGSLVSVPANRCVDTDRFAAGHAGRYVSWANCGQLWQDSVSSEV